MTQILGYVSSYPPMRCAIGLYTQHLATALCDQDAEAKLAVFTERHVEATGSTERLSVVPCYDRNDDYVDTLESAIVQQGCDLVHFQHAGDLLGEDRRLPLLLDRLAQRRIRTVVTLHTVYAEHAGRVFARGTQHADFYRATGRAATQLLVHQDEGCAQRLCEQGIDPSKISIIAHGTSRLQPTAQKAARRALGLPEDAFIFAFFGFIHLQKNVHRIVEAFAKIARSAPNARLLVAGMPWGDKWYNHLYTQLMKLRVAGTGLSARVLIRDRYVPPEHVPHLYGASDVMLLPHDQSYGSASGVFHQAIGAGKPVICSIGPKFVEAREALASVPELCVPPKSTRDWSRAMQQVMRNASLLERGARAVQDYATQTEWPTIASRHWSLYRRLL